MGYGGCRSTATLKINKSPCSRKKQTNKQNTNRAFCIFIPAIKIVKKLSTKSSILISGFSCASLTICSNISLGVSSLFCKAKHRSSMTFLAKRRRYFIASMTEFWKGNADIWNIQNGFWKFACIPSSVFDTALGNAESGFPILFRLMPKPTWDEIWSNHINKDTAGSIESDCINRVSQPPSQPSFLLSCCKQKWKNGPITSNHRTHFHECYWLFLLPLITSSTIQCYH